MTGQAGAGGQVGRDDMPLTTPVNLLAMLAYVFWHWPTSGMARPSYETAMVDFHERLRDAGSPALLGSRTFRVEGEPWLPDGRGYVDWYLLDGGFASLGVLNELAVSPSLKEVHDRPAYMVEGGAGGVYRLIASGGGGQPPVTATWLSKPATIPIWRSLNGCARGASGRVLHSGSASWCSAPRSSSACSRRHCWRFQGIGVPSRRDGPCWVTMREGVVEIGVRLPGCWHG